MNRTNESVARGMAEIETLVRDLSGALDDCREASDAMTDTVDRVPLAAAIDAVLVGRGALGEAVNHVRMAAERLRVFAEQPRPVRLSSGGRGGSSAEMVQ